MVVPDVAAWGLLQGISVTGSFTLRELIFTLQGNTAFRAHSPQATSWTHFTRRIPSIGAVRKLADEVFGIISLLLCQIEYL
jgi:hypothetical protein